MANKQRWVKRAFLLALSAIAFASLAEATYLNASLVNSSDQTVRDLAGLGTTSILYDASAGSFIDKVSGLNPDVTLRVCANASGDLSGKYATAVYMVGSSAKAIAKVGADATFFHALGSTYDPGDGNYCANVTMDWNFVSGYSDYPAYIYAVVSDDTTLDIGDGDTFIFMPTSNGWLNGGYTTNVATIPSQYNQATGYMNGVQVTSATGRKGDNSLVEVAGNNNKYIMIGVCSVVGGLWQYSCSDSTTTNRNTDVNLSTGVTYSSYGYSDTHTNRSLVVNGIPQNFCMGPDLTITISANDSSPNDGDDVKLNATVTNNGNVNITSSFNVSFYKDSVAPGNRIGSAQSVASLAKGASSTVSVVWDTFNSTGSHTIYAVADPEGAIDECAESNQATTPVDVQATYFAILWIDGVQTYNFTNPGEPYNVTVAVKKSTWVDGDWLAVPNATVWFVERNGIMEFGPVQAWNESGDKKGLNSYAVAEVVTNSSGGASFVLIPTGNGTFTQYSGLPLTDYVQDYSIYIEIYVSGAKVPIYLDGVSYGDSQPLYMTSQVIPQPSSQKTVMNDGFVEYIMNMAYTIYSRVKGWLTYGA